VEDELVADDWMPPQEEDNGGWAVRTEPKPRPEAENPFEAEEWGRLPRPCGDCGGTHGHAACCPIAVEEEAQFLARPSRIQLIRRIARDGRYDPRDQMLEQAAEYDRAGPLERSLRDPGGWGDHYRAVARRLDEIMPPRDQDPKDTSETWQQYLNRRSLTAPKQPPQPKRLVNPATAKKKHHHGATLFDAEFADNLGDA
jgi:hypothetical protein